MTTDFLIEIRENVTEKINDPRLLLPFRRAGRQSIELIAGDARKNAPVGVSGGAGLRGSIATQEDAGRPIPRWWKATVGVPYGEDVEYGSPPRWISYKEGTPLYRWVQLKLQQGGIARARRSGAARAAGQISTRALAFLVARKIARDGTEPQPFLIPAFEDNERRVDRLFQGALREIERSWNGR